SWHWSLAVQTTPAHRSTQVPFWHVALAASQTIPQPPQLLPSEEKSGLITSPCAWCAGTALWLTVMKTNGFFAEPVRWHTPTLVAPPAPPALASPSTPATAPPPIVFRIRRRDEPFAKVLMSSSNFSDSIARSSFGGLPHDQCPATAHGNAGQD